MTFDEKMGILARGRYCFDEVGERGFGAVNWRFISGCISGVALICDTTSGRAPSKPSGLCMSHSEHSK